MGAFKMKGFPQHAGVSPLRDDVKSHVSLEDLRKGSGRPEPKTKFGKWWRKQKKLDAAYLKARARTKKFGKKINEFASSDAGKAVITGLTKEATVPRPKKEVVAIIEGEQKSIM